MGSLIIACYILAISLFECSKVEGIDCSKVSFCTLPETDLDFLCPIVPLRSDETFLYLRRVEINGNSIIGILIYKLETSVASSTEWNQEITIDICDPPRDIIEMGRDILVRATLSGDRYRISDSCSLIPVVYNKMRFDYDVGFMVKYSAPRQFYCAMLDKNPWRMESFEEEP